MVKGNEGTASRSSIERRGCTMGRQANRALPAVRQADEINTGSARLL
jgi:hypothetical protein